MTLRDELGPVADVLPLMGRIYRAGDLNRALASELRPGCVVRFDHRSGWDAFEGIDEHGRMVMVDVTGAKWTFTPFPGQTFTFSDFGATGA